MGVESAETACFLNLPAEECNFLVWQIYHFWEFFSGFFFRVTQTELSVRAA